MAMRKAKQEINWNATNEDRVLAVAISARAVSDKLIRPGQALDIQMSVTACHLNGCPLRLKDLLDADAFNFAHDVLGINRHVNRDTGALGDCFLPRFHM